MLLSTLRQSLLTVLAATLYDLITRAEAKGYLRVLEDRLAAIFGVPTPFLSLQDKMKSAWQTFAGNYNARSDCERLLRELRPPLPPSSLLEAFAAQESRAPSIEEMKRRAHGLDASAYKGRFFVNAAIGAGLTGAGTL